MFNEYYDPEEYTIHSSASTLAAVQHVLRFHPTLMLISLFLGAAGLFWERGPRRALIALLLACSLALLLTPAIATTYGARYAIPVDGLLAAAGALGLASVIRVVRERQRAPPHCSSVRGRGRVRDSARSRAFCALRR